MIIDGNKSHAAACFFSLKSNKQMNVNKKTNEQVTKFTTKQNRKIQQKAKERNS